MVQNCRTIPYPEVTRAKPRPSEYEGDITNWPIKLVVFSGFQCVGQIANADSAIAGWFINTKAKRRKGSQIEVAAVVVDHVIS